MEAAASSFEHVLVAGAGQMGAGIAQMADRGLVEDEAVKLALFHGADEVLPAEAILASNTSSIPITSLGGATARPDRVIGMHFFNPVPVMGLVEVVYGLETSDETAAAIVGLATELGKTAAEASDLPGFVANRILMPFINEAAFAVLEGAITEVLHEGHGDTTFAPCPLLRGDVQAGRLGRKTGRGFSTYS